MLYIQLCVTLQLHEWLMLKLTVNQASKTPPNFPSNRSRRIHPNVSNPPTANPNVEDLFYFNLQKPNSLWLVPDNFPRSEVGLKV